MAKVLYAASRASHLINFHLPYLQRFTENGWEVHALAEGAREIPWCSKCYDVTFEKKISSFKNWRTIAEIYRILRAEQYDLISVHTTLAAFLTRLAVRLYGCRKVTVINTCHGYLFSQNTAKLKKLCYIAAEKICRPATQLLLVMNGEDYALAQRYKLSAGEIALIPGMGLPPQKPPTRSAEAVRQSLGLHEADFIAVYAAEFSARKNQAFLLNALPPIVQQYPQFKLILAGTGSQLAQCQQLVQEKNLQANVIMPGHVTDMPAILQICQLAISASRSEGLPFNIMEALAAGVPVLASRVKGHVDLLREGENGLTFAPDSAQDFAAKLTAILAGGQTFKQVTLADAFYLAQAQEIIWNQIKTCWK